MSMINLGGLGIGEIFITFELEALQSSFRFIFLIQRSFGFLDQNSWRITLLVTDTYDYEELLIIPY